MTDVEALAKASDLATGWMLVRGIRSAPRIRIVRALARALMSHGALSAGDVDTIAGEQVHKWIKGEQ